MGRLGIGQLAEAAHVPVATLRYYEKRQLIPPPSCSPGGYRLYPMHTIKDVGFIRRARRLGDLVRMRDDLAGLIGSCRSADEDDCPIIHSLEAADVTDG